MVPARAQRRGRCAARHGETATWRLSHRLAIAMPGPSARPKHSSVACVRRTARTPPIDVENPPASTRSVRTKTRPGQHHHPGTALSDTQTGRDDGVKALPLDEWHPESQRITPQPHGYVPDRLEVNVFPFPIHIYMSRLLALVQTTSPKPSPLKSPVVAIT